MPVLDAGCGIEDNLRSLVDSCEDFWGNLCLEELSSSVPSLGFNFDWDDVESLLSDQATEPILTMDGDDGTDVLDAVKKEKNRKRRLNEAERLQKYSWERVVRSDDTRKKRSRYNYVNRNSGATISSLRLALQHCHATAEVV